jgi:hypothetical protein
MFKSAIGNMSAGYEQFTKNAKQAAEVLEANVTNAVDQMSQAGAKWPAPPRSNRSGFSRRNECPGLAGAFF